MVNSDFVVRIQILSYFLNYTQIKPFKKYITKETHETNVFNEYNIEFKTKIPRY